MAIVTNLGYTPQSPNGLILEKIFHYINYALNQHFSNCALWNLKIFSGIVPKAQPAALTFDPVEGQAGKEQKCQLSKQHSCFHLLSGPREGGKSFVKEGSQELLPITQITSKENLSQKVGKESGSFPPSKIRNQQNTYVPCKHPHNLPHICFFQYLGWAG